ncbi:MAG: FG-GAP-like repeat-containing protein [candidate division WOR-3 bacterium]
MKKIILLFLFVLTLNSMDFVLIDTFNDAPNHPGVAIKCGDLDNDGNREIIFVSDSIFYKRIFVYEHSPAGGFYHVHTVPVESIPEWPYLDLEFGMGDFDNDGKSDIFQTFVNGISMMEHFQVVESPFINSYPNTIIWKDSIYINGNGPGNCIWVGDFDHDSKNEIVMYKQDDESGVLIYENQGDNFYTLKFFKKYTYGFPWAVADLGDLDMDDYPEIFFGEGIGSPTHPLKVFEFAGNDSLVHVADAYIYLWESSNLYDVVFCGDVNGNGKPEVMIHGTDFIGMYTNRDNIWLIEATGDNQYELVWYDSLYTPADQEMGCRSSAGDVTGDGIPEIILSLTTAVRIIQYIPGYGYAYIWHKQYAYNTGNISTAVYDINNNGINDVIISVQHQEENRVTYILERSPSVSEKYLKITPYFYVLPKITSDSLKISYFLKSSKSADFYIYNILGEKIYFKKLKKEGEFYLNLKRLKFAPGIYFLRILSPEIKKTEKVIFWRK